MDQSQRDQLLIETNTLVHEVHKAVFGNGQPGALDRLTRTEEAVKALQASVPTKLERFGASGTLITIIAAVIAKVIGLPIPI